jgi:hypothetical protein
MRTEQTRLLAAYNAWMNDNYGSTDLLFMPSVLDG